MNIVQLVESDAPSLIASGLRDLADAVERGDHPGLSNISCVIDCADGVETTLLGHYDIIRAIGLFNLAGVMLASNMVEMP